MEERDYYEILGISRDAKESDIKRAYKRLAMKFHPDRNQGDKKAEIRFKEVKKAYEILIDAQKRALYDQHGHAAFNQNSMGPDAAGAANFSDIFGDVFGDIFGGRRSRGERGSDLLHKLELTLEEAVRGTKKEFSLFTQVVCVSCRGSGAKSGTSPVTCSTCHGAGQIAMQRGFFAIQQTCPNCRGQGKIIRNPCQDCRGHGRVEKQKTLSVKIPNGVDTGDRIRLSGEGAVGTLGTPAGDLYVEIMVKKHPIFQRKENDLYCELPISFTLAALGGKVDVPILNGQVKLTIPEETQSGKLFRLRGKGVQALRSGTTGDLLCRVVVETPVSLNQRQKELLVELEQSFNRDNTDQHRPRSKSFFSGIKKFFEDLTH